MLIEEAIKHCEEKAKCGDASEDAWEDQHKGKWVKIQKEIQHENQ